MILVMVDTEMEMTRKGGAQAYNYYNIGHDYNDVILMTTCSIEL